MLTRRDKLRKLYKRAVNAVTFGQEDRSVPVFIFGEMRSGTNMLTECLDRSMRTEIFNEFDDEAFDGYVLREDSHIATLIEQSNATHVVFKALTDSARASQLLERFAHSKGIWIYRRFEDVVNSAVEKWSEHNQYLHYVLHEPERARWRRANLSSETIALIREHYERGLSDMSARALIWYVRNNLFFEQNLHEHSAVRLLKYEDVAAAPRTNLPEIFDFIELPFDERYMKHISARSIGRSNAPEIDTEVLELCRSLISRLDDIWNASRRDTRTIAS